MPILGKERFSTVEEIYSSFCSGGKYLRLKDLNSGMEVIVIGDPFCEHIDILRGSGVLYDVDKTENKSKPIVNDGGMFFMEKINDRYFFYVEYISGTSSTLAVGDGEGKDRKIESAQRIANILNNDIVVRGVPKTRKIVVSRQNLE